MVQFFQYNLMYINIIIYVFVCLTKKSVNIIFNYLKQHRKLLR